MLQVIDTEYFRGFFALPDGAERLERMFGQMMDERDEARDLAKAAAAGFKAAEAHADKSLARADELLAANTTGVAHRRALADLLRKCATRFRFYEQQHRDKPPSEDTIRKAEANREIAEEIEALLMVVA